MELSGHKSERYIWRYIQASEEEMEEALESASVCRTSVSKRKLLTCVGVRQV